MCFLFSELFHSLNYLARLFLSSHEIVLLLKKIFSICAGSPGLLYEPTVSCENLSHINDHTVLLILMSISLFSVAFDNMRSSGQCASLVPGIQ
jgi:hypothetical protein